MRSPRAESEFHLLLLALITILGSWGALALGSASIVAYSAFYYYVIVSSNLGIFAVAIPLWLAGLQIVSGAFLITVSFEYSFLSSRKFGLGLGGVGSTGTILIGSSVVSCACSAPVAASILYLLGLNAIQVSAVITFVAEYQFGIISFLVAFNVLLTWKFLRRISKLIARIDPSIQKHSVTG